MEIMTIKELEKLKKDIYSRVEKCNDLIYTLWHKDKKEFLDYILNDLFNYPLGDLKIEEIKLINFINKNKLVNVKVALDIK